MTAKKPRKVRREGRPSARTYWTKAQRFARSARAALAAGDWDPAASSAIHAAVNLLDAVCVFYRQERNASGNHEDALAILGEIHEAPPKLRKLLHRHAGALLSMKSLAEYEARLLEEPDAAKAVADMEQCIAALRGLADAEGWA